MLKRQLISGLKCITKWKSNPMNLQSTKEKNEKIFNKEKGWTRLMAFTISILHFVPACNTIFEFRLSHQFVSFFKFIINAFNCIFVISGPIDQCFWIDIWILINVGFIPKFGQIIFLSRIIIEVIHSLFAPIHANAPYKSIMPIEVLSIWRIFLQQIKKYIITF